MHSRFALRLSHCIKLRILFLSSYFSMDNIFLSRYHIANAIGNTPIVQFKKIVPENCAAIFVKLEYFNPTGSYKDRMGLSMIEEAEKRGDLKPGMTVAESTAGGTGTSLALVCSIKGYHLHIVTSDAFSKEKLQSMKLFGADLELIKSHEGKTTPDLVPRMISRVQELSGQENIYWTNQFENKDSLEGYQLLGKEILDQIGTPIDAFCAAVGTGGMFTGVSIELGKSNPSTKFTVLEPASSPVISKGIKGSHTVDGICPGFIPPLLSNTKYDRVMAIEESESRKMTRLLASEEGIFAGVSTGMNVIAAIQIGKELGPGHTVVTVACDSGMKYLASGLFD
jgi:cysteine synthase A